MTSLLNLSYDKKCHTHSCHSYPLPRPSLKITICNSIYTWPGYSNTSIVKNIYLKRANLLKGKGAKSPV
jgi:hypothetical protein